eukprot:6073742-Amphidinium_carterae.1
MEALLFGCHKVASYLCLQLEQLIMAWHVCPQLCRPSDLLGFGLASRVPEMLTTQTLGHILYLPLFLVALSAPRFRHSLSAYQNGSILAISLHIRTMYMMNTRNATVAFSISSSKFADLSQLFTLSRSQTQQTCMEGRQPNVQWFISMVVSALSEGHMQHVCHFNRKIVLPSMSFLPADLGCTTIFVSNETACALEPMLGDYAQIGVACCEDSTVCRRHARMSVRYQNSSLCNNVMENAHLKHLQIELLKYVTNFEVQKLVRTQYRVTL